MPRKRKTPYPTDSDQRELKVETGSSPPGCHTGDEEGPPGWHHRDDESLRRQSGEAVPLDFNLPDSRKPVGAPRTRESKFSPAPSHFPRGPPGFDNESRFSPSPIHFPAVPSNPPGFDKSDSFHGVKMIYQESLEITSDRPFLPQRRAPPGGSNMSSPHVRIPRGDKQGDRVELRGLSRSPLTSVAAEESNAQETPEGGSRKSLSVGKIRKKMQPSTNDDQPAHAGMYKNQLQELAQRSCFNLPAYARIREGPDHAPRFKATVNFNGEVFESPNYCNTLRQAEHAAAEVALNTLSRRGPSQSLAARILDETGVCKNLLQETAQRAGTIVSVSSFEKAASPTLRPGIPGEPPGLPSGGAMIPSSSTVDNRSESPSDDCLKLFKEFADAMRQRERALRERERNLKQNNINKQGLEEEIKQAAALKYEVIEERRRLEEEAQRIRKEKDDLDRTSTDIALQTVELKQILKEIRKEKAAISALKLELGARERCSQEQECVETTVHIPLGILKAEIGKPVSNPRISCSQIGSLSSDSEPDTEIDILDISRIMATANGRNQEFVKSEPVSSGWDAIHEDESMRNNNFSEDEMDDVPLFIRLNRRRTTKTREKSRSSEEIKHVESNVESSRKGTGSQSVGAKSQAYDIHTKRNKVPIEVALQEDAPGLLEQLEERGVLEDMTVYQDMEMDDSLPVECSGSEFGILQGVIGKLWGPSAGLGKDLVPVKGQVSSNMPRYCLACLLSLIEQAKSLRKRNWPVEWGWCRRLRAFLFVFEKHNRIVLERPEYGYATYFFELVQKLPVRWQVQRLITVMSVATTGRAALLENRPLEVGVHLTNEEAAILEDYGWNPSSGLGSLLNFCERVVHDYNKGQEDLGYDWKQKIGKLLMDGYDHGRIVTSIPRKLQSVLGDNLSDTDSFTGSQMKAERA
ncbi:hypothetical protein KC19_12G173800 [Ceratodon purpureus]|uniref:DRBM domain-containing protein n=1 Tax=Ceratodon purpureus TaxID=3225 RepID=A0A8T0G8E2_CERPU|nr:hypothetical protein KC19_12G173800 [Ceratodon purpureus]